MEKRNIPWYGFVALILTILFLSGIFTNSEGPLSALDYSNVLGTFGTMGSGGQGTDIAFAKDFQGIGGVGVKSAFLLVLSISPGIILAYAVIELFKNYKGDVAAEFVFNPILKPLFGVPGRSIVAITASLTTTDGGAAITKELYDNNYINYKENMILSQFQYSSPAPLINVFSIAAPLAPYIPTQLSVCLIVILAMKVLGAILCRIYVNIFMEGKGNNND